MDIGSINLVAVLVAAVGAFAFGAAYYGLLGKPWMKAARIDPLAMRMSAAPFVTSFIAELVMAAVLAAFIGALSGGTPTATEGVAIGFFAWLGFMTTTMAVNHRYEGFGWDLTLIDAGHWLGVALLQGAVIGWFGVRAVSG
jgi:hypothetical protein